MGIFWFTVGIIFPLFWVKSRQFWSNFVIFGRKLPKFSSLAPLALAKNPCLGEGFGVLGWGFLTNRKFFVRGGGGILQFRVDLIPPKSIFLV